jgi:hypothetical protein
MLLYRKSTISPWILYKKRLNLFFDPGHAHCETGLKIFKNIFSP